MGLKPATTITILIITITTSTNGTFATTTTTMLLQYFLQPVNNRNRTSALSIRRVYVTQKDQFTRYILS